MPAPVPAPPPGPAVVPFAIPLRARFRGVTVREGLLLRGPAGWGEFAPFPDYGVADCAPWLRAAREAASADWPAPRRSAVPVNAIVPAVDPETAQRMVREAGCATVKVKVGGGDPGDDEARVAAVRDALGPGGRIRIDANGAWTVDEAVAALKALDAAAGGLEYAEQPCRSVEDLAALRRRVDVPVAADESIRRAADPLRVAALRAADVAVLKVAPLGGVAACLELAERIRLPVVVSSAVDTSVGLAAGLALAAALPDLPYACGLGTGHLLARDVVADPLLPVDGFLAVRRPQPDPALLAGVRPSPATAAAWRDRLAATAACAPETRDHGDFSSSSPGESP